MSEVASGGSAVSAYAVTDPTGRRTPRLYPTATDAEVEAALTSATLAAARWRVTPVAARAALLARAADLVDAQADGLARIAVEEMGKPLDQAVAEVEFVAAILRFYASGAEAFLADETIAVESGSAVVRKTAIGTLLGVMPWNFPYYQLARFAAPNLAAGNTVLIKPAPQCPESALAFEAVLQQAAREAGAPRGLVQTVLATEQQVAGLVADPRIAGVSVTGSERAGAVVAETAGRHLTKVVLELGGSDPFVLLSTDDLDAVVDQAVQARLDNNGQVCNAPKRFVIVDGLYDAFAAAFTARMADVVPGDPAEEGTVLGPLSSVAAADRLERQLDRAASQGARMLLRGERRGAAVPPAVLTGVTPQMDAYREEFFGPVAVLHRAADEHDAVRIANDSPFGLGAYVFSTDPDQAARVAERLDAGMVWINLVLGDAPELPFGGTKRSGFGRELGSAAVDEFVNRKLIRVA